jgi:hypothetical protein
MQTFAKTQRQETSNERGGSVKPASVKEQSRLFGIMGLQQSIGNAAVGRLLRQVAAEAAARKASDTQRQEDSETTGPEVNSNGPIHSPGDPPTQTEPAVQAGTKPVLGESPTQSDNASVDNQAGMPGPTAQAPILTPVGTQASDNKFVSFTQSSASSIARTISTFGGEVRQEFEAVRTSSAEQAPIIKVTLPGDPESAAAEKPQPKKPAALPSAYAITAPSVSTGDGLTAEETAVPSQPDGEGVSTSAGVAPKMRLEGDADPTYLSTATSQSQAIGTEIRNQIATEIVDVASAATIQRTGVEREEEISITATNASPAIHASQEMLEFINTDVPANVRAIADADFAPLLERSLAGPRQQVEQATQQRDADRDQAFANAMAETEAASQQAHDDQQKAVKDGYEQIAAEKQKGLEEGQQTLAEFDTEVKQRHAANDELIRTKVQTEQEKADEAVRKGEEDAVAAEQKAQEDKRIAEEEAERNKPKKKKNRWGQVVSWFKDAIKDWTNKLVSAVKTVFSKAKEFVSKALTAAKNFAIGIIRSVKSFVVSAIQTFAAGLKILVNGLLVAFPALRDKVNAAIDGVVAVTVQIVETVASKLEDTVTAVVDKVQSTVNKILDFCELVIVTQIQIAGALLSGDFLEAAKILFLAACKAVGIPGEEFLDILADASDALLDIIKRPAKFLGYLLKAVGQGMKSFFSNFPQRMVAGLTGWLFGQVAEGGITLPKSFDLKNIFTLLLQVMGFTYDYIRGKVISLVGEKAVSVVEQVMTPIRILFTEGPGALWHWLADQADQAKKAIVEAASQWLITQIITQAAIKLATMFTPVGAFVQAVLMMYNTIMFFVEKIKEIFAWVKSITASLKTIATGAISAAADYIDQAMSKSIPLIITFLAKLLGIDGVAGKIRQVVTKLRTPVDKAITFVVENLIKLAKAAWSGIKKGATAVKDAVVNWWNTEESFKTQDGVPHRLFFEGSGEAAVLMVASEKEPVAKKGEKLEKAGIIDAGKKQRISSHESQIKTDTTQESKSQASTTDAVKQNVKSIGDELSELPSLESTPGSAGAEAAVPDLPNYVENAVKSVYFDFASGHFLLLQHEITEGAKAAGVRLQLTELDLNASADEPIAQLNTIGNSRATAISNTTMSSAARESGFRVVGFYERDGIVFPTWISKATAPRLVHSIEAALNHRAKEAQQAAEFLKDLGIGLAIGTAIGVMWGVAGGVFRGSPTAPKGEPVTGTGKITEGPSAPQQGATDIYLPVGSQKQTSTTAGGISGPKGTKSVAIVGPKGKLGEFDEVLPNLFVEDKTGAATGIKKGMKFTGKSFDQAANDWAVKNIYQKTVVRIENLSKSTATIAEEGGSRIVPHLDEIKSIRTLHFRIEGNDPILMRHVNDQINRLRTMFPDWKFTVEFGT